MRLFGQLTKIEDQPDGTLKVYGVASTGARDDEGEIVLPEAMKAALPDYARYPALREMHQPTAAGRTLEATVDEDGATRIVAQVVDPVAIAKVRSRTYAGFSIGGRVLARDAADPTVITKIRLAEISLVDRPANPEAVIDLWKAAAPSPGNDAVKALAARMAEAAGKRGRWQDFVAKARAALIADGHAEDDSDDVEGDEPEAPRERIDLADADDDPSMIAMRLAELAAADPRALQALHDALAALGAVCDPDNSPGGPADRLPDDEADKTVSAGELAKLERSFVTGVLARAEPRLAALERRLASQDARIERLAATPLPPRTAASPHVSAFGKADDADPGSGSDPRELSAADAQKAFAALTPDERAFLLMKASLRQPIPLP